MMREKQLHINGNCAPLKVGIVDSDCLWNKRGKISASHSGCGQIEKSADPRVDHVMDDLRHPSHQSAL